MSFVCKMVSEVVWAQEGPKIRLISRRVEIKKIALALLITHKASFKESPRREGYGRAKVNLSPCPVRLRSVALLL